MRILFVFVLIVTSSLSHAFEKADYVIVMEDVIARVESTGPSRTITRFVVRDKVTQAIVFDQSGCQLTECSFDLSTLSAGDYTAEATQDDGSTFSEDISLK
ncbi:MAG: hypothetical protein AAGG75_16815 [Bacteroidota bacterium]